MNDTIVIGLGNALMSDEGIGIAVIEGLREREDIPAGVEIVEAGTSGPAMLHMIAGREKVIIVDCTDMGEAPGTVRRFTPEQVRTKKELSGLSLHEADALRILEVSRSLGEYPDEVVIYGIQPEQVAPGTELSAPLAERLDEYVERIAAELREQRDA